MWPSLSFVLCFLFLMRDFAFGLNAAVKSGFYCHCTTHPLNKLSDTFLLQVQTG